MTHLVFAIIAFVVVALVAIRLAAMNIELKDERRLHHGLSPKAVERLKASRRPERDEGVVVRKKMIKATVPGLVAFGLLVPTYILVISGEMTAANTMVFLLVLSLIWLGIDDFHGCNWAYKVQHFRGIRQSNS